MKKMTLTSYWSPEEAHSILLFLDELREILLANYGDDIAEHHRQRQQADGDIDFDFEDHTIPF